MLVSRDVNAPSDCSMAFRGRWARGNGGPQPPRTGCTRPRRDRMLRVGTCLPRNEVELPRAV